MTDNGYCEEEVKIMQEARWYNNLKNSEAFKRTEARLKQS